MRSWRCVVEELHPEVFERRDDKSTVQKVVVLFARRFGNEQAPEVAKKLRVSPDKVRAWIERGELAAFNVADRVGGRPRWRIEPEALAEFQRRRASLTNNRRRQRRETEQAGFVRYFS